MIPLSVEKRLTFLALLIGVFVSVAVTPSWNYDPINLGKVLCLTTLSFSCFGLLLPYCKTLASRDKAIWTVSILFLLSLWSSFFFSGANKSQQFWGVFGRATGILTYMSLLAAFLIYASIQKRYFYQRTISVLIFTTLLIGAYALVQVSGNDPIRWSSYAAFGTLGNVNFLSGFMGISTIVMLVLALSSETTSRTRFLCLVSTVTGLAVVYQTDSIQGLVAFAAGVAALTLIKAGSRGFNLLIPVFALAVVGFLALVLALFNKGPLASLVYQVTIIYRADYMHAAIKMLLHNPLFGVGIDSYDDWYRAERGTVSAFRTGFSRTANSAHNVALDLGAGGGLPLLLVYIAIMFLVLSSILKGLRNGLFRDSIFVAAVCGWIAYQVQAAVSINQIGVGVWGWILSGVIIGFTRTSQKDKKENVDRYDFFKDVFSRFPDTKVAKTKQPNTPPPLPVISSAFLTFIGFSLAFIPFKTDIDFRKAMNAGELSRIIEVVKQPASQSFHISQASSLAFQNNYPDQGRELAELLVSRYPRNFFGWALISSSPAFSSTRQAQARIMLISLDPNEAICLYPPATDALLKELGQLPQEKQEELILGWGLNVPSTAFPLRNPSGSTGDAIRERVSTFCS